MCRSPQTQQRAVASEKPGLGSDGCTNTHTSWLQQTWRLPAVISSLGVKTPNRANNLHPRSTCSYTTEQLQSSSSAEFSRLTMQEDRSWTYSSVVTSFHTRSGSVNCLWHSGRNRPEAVFTLISQRYLVYVSSDVFVLDDDQQSVVGVIVVQKGHRTLLHVPLLQQVFLEDNRTHTY